MNGHACAPTAARDRPVRRGGSLVSFLTSWFPMLLLIGVWIFLMARFGVLTRQFVFRNAALFGVVVLLLFPLFNLFTPLPPLASPLFFETDLRKI